MLKYENNFSLMMIQLFPAIVQVIRQCSSNRTRGNDCGTPLFLACNSYLKHNYNGCHSDANEKKRCHDKRSKSPEKVSHLQQLCL